MWRRCTGAFLAGDRIAGAGAEWDRTKKTLDVPERRGGAVHRVAACSDGHTVRGTLPVSFNIRHIHLCPVSAVGPNISGQPPSMTVMPCSRP